MSKRSVMRLAISFLMVFLYAQGILADTLTVQTAIQKVTIYERGALVNRKARLKLPTGVTMVKLPLLSPAFDPKTLQVGVSNLDIKIGKVDTHIELPNIKEISHANDSLVKRSKVCEDSIQLVQSFSGVLDHERDILLSNDDIGGSKGFNAEQLGGVAAYLRKDLGEIEDLQQGYSQKRKVYELEQQLISQQLKLLDERQMVPKGVVYVSLVTEAPAETEIELNYVVKDAEWTPFYELKIVEDKAMMEVSKKVMVHQNSMEDWKEVKLTVTKTNPSESNAKPTLERYTLPYATQRSKPSAPAEKKMVKVMGNVRDAKGSISGVIVQAKNNQSTQTDESGFYQILVPENTELTFSHASHLAVDRSVGEGYVKVLNVRMMENAQKIYGRGVVVKGQVRSSRGPLSGASVIATGSSSYAFSNENGYFEINAMIGSTLEIAHEDFKMKQVKIDNMNYSRTIDVELEPQIVTPQWSAKVSGGHNKLEYSIDQALAGRASGVKISSASGSPGSASSIQIRGLSSLTGSNEPLYVVDGIPINGGGVSFGDNPLASINPDDILSMEVLKDASSTSIYGARASNGVVMITTKKGNHGSGLYLSTFSHLKDYTAEATTLNSIPSDGSEHEAMIGKVSIPVKYSYYTAPKISPNVYMLAEVPNWKVYDILQGKLRLFHDNTYIGESYWHPEEIQDTLHFSAGIEKNIGVERRLKATNKGKNLLRTSDKVLREWEIIVKNNKDFAVEVTVEDQIPVSTGSEVKVNLIESSQAKVDEAMGRLTWNLKLAPGEKKIINLSYEVVVKDGAHEYILRNNKDL